MGVYQGQREGTGCDPIAIQRGGVTSASLFQREHSDGPGRNATALASHLYRHRDVLTGGRGLGRYAGDLCRRTPLEYRDDLGVVQDHPAGRSGNGLIPCNGRTETEDGLALLIRRCRFRGQRVSVTT